MDEKVIEQLGRLHYNNIAYWFGNETRTRGFGCHHAVGSAYDLGDRLAAHVYGTHRYVVNLFCTERGECSSVCTCPVGVNCKHGAALAFVAAEMLEKGYPFEAASNDDLRLDEKSIRKAHGLEEDGSVPYSEYDLARIAKYRRDVSDARERLLECCKQGDRERITEATVHFLLCVDDDDTYNYPGEFEAEFALVDPTLEIVVETMRKRGMSTAELIVWAYYLQRPCHCCGVGNVIDALIECPMGTEDDSNVWTKAALALERDLDAYHAAGSIDKEFDEEYQLGAIRNAWQRAGDEARAIPCWLKCVDSVCNWEETAELLLRNEHYDDLIAVVRRGIGKYDCDCDGMQTFLAKAFSRKCDHAKAAAIRAEQFLSFQGCQEHYRTLGMFYEMLKEAELAGVRDGLRKAIVHALETGRNPTPLIDFPAKPEEPPDEWRRLPRRVTFRSTLATSEEPPWPLPKANEGVMHSELRWDIHLDWCQFDQEFLLRIAVAEGKREEVAVRFAELPKFPVSSDYCQRHVEGWLMDLEKLMMGYRPDIVEVIRNPNLHWMSPKNRPKFMWKGK